MKRTIISAVTIFSIISGLSFIAAVRLFHKTGENIDSTTVVICVLLGVIAGALDVRSSYRMPPVKLEKLIELARIQTQNENEKSNGDK
jgi:hypothetical protein